MGKRQTEVRVQLRNRCKSDMRGLGPWVWLAYREDRCNFSSHTFPPCFLTFVRRVHSQVFEGGISTPRFFASGWVVYIRIDRIMSARDAGRGAR